MLVSVSVPKLSAAARWGYYKACRKTGEFAHAIGAFLVDPGRGVSRAVIGATESRPIVVADAGHLVGEREIDRKAADRLIEERGMSDPIERRIHVAALARAVETGRNQ
jgi:carbon-monoxide dehydrogenase medium subunit